MELKATFALAVLFTAVFMLLDHRRNGKFEWPSQLSYADLIQQAHHGNQRRRIAFVLLLVGSVIVMLLFPLRSRFSLRANGYAMAGWLAWETCSIAWSVHPPLSARSLVPWIITAGVGVSTGSELSVKGCVIVIAFVCSAFLVVGIHNELFNGFSDEHAGYRFAGTLDPNHQGLNCAILAFSYTYLGLTKSMPSTIAIICMIVGVGVLGLTRSRTAFWAAESAAVIWAAIIPPNSSRAWPLGLAVTIVLTGILVSSPKQLKTLVKRDLESGLAAFVSLGRSDSAQARTLNNRTGVWKLILSSVGRRWVCGVGFGAFWDVSRIERIRASFPFPVLTCHSDYLEIVVRSGAIGTALFVATVLSSMFLALGLHVADGYFIFSLFVFVVIEGFLETAFSRPGCESLFMFLLFGTLAAARCS
jgi:hypothetical protein